MENFQVINDYELQHIEGGGINTVAVGSLLLGVFNAGYNFGKDLARRGR